MGEVNDRRRSGARRPSHRANEGLVLRCDTVNLAPFDGCDHMMYMGGQTITFTPAHMDDILRLVTATWTNMLHTCCTHVCTCALVTMHSCDHAIHNGPQPGFNHW